MNSRPRIRGSFGGSRPQPETFLSCHFRDGEKSYMELCGTAASRNRLPYELILLLSKKRNVGVSSSMVSGMEWKRTEEYHRGVGPTRAWQTSLIRYERSI
jgi:hypothetical protein